MTVRLNFADFELSVARTILLPVRTAAGTGNLIRPEGHDRSVRSDDRSSDLPPHLRRAHCCAACLELSELLPCGGSEWVTEENLKRPHNIMLKGA